MLTLINIVKGVGWVTLNPQVVTRSLIKLLPRLARYVISGHGTLPIGLPMSFLTSLPEGRWWGREEEGMLSLLLHLLLFLLFSYLLQI